MHHTNNKWTEASNEFIIALFFLHNQLNGLSQSLNPEIQQEKYIIGRKLFIKWIKSLVSQDQFPYRTIAKLQCWQSVLKDEAEPYS